MAQVKIIAPQTREAEHLRVAAYCRVSTDNEEQASSYEAQIEHYEEYIKTNPEWEFVGVYADEGISATSTKTPQALHFLLRCRVAFLRLCRYFYDIHRFTSIRL